MLTRRFEKAKLGHIPILKGTAGNLLVEQCSGARGGDAVCRLLPRGA
jgi:hypothetical protein